MTMKKLIESIDKLNEAYLPPNHPDWDLPPAERMAKQNERIAADSSADAEVWHKGLKPAAPTKPVEEQGVSEGFNGISVNIEPELDYDVVYVDINGKKYNFNYWYTDEKPTDELGFRKDIPHYLKREEWYNKLDFPTKMEVLHAVVQAELGNEPSEYQPTVGDEPLDEQGVNEGTNHRKESALRAKLPTNEGFTVTPGINRERYTDLSAEGLEGPFQMKNGKVLYYDPRQGQYYDRDTDMFVDYDDYAAMNEDEELTELSRGKLNDYMSKAADDSQKHDMDPSKRPAVKRNKSVGGVKNAFNKLHLQGMVKVPATESAESSTEAAKVLKIIEKAKKILAMLQDDSVSDEEKARLRDKVAGLNDMFEGLRNKIGALNEVSPVQPVQPVQPTQPSTPAQQAANTGNDQTQQGQQADQNNPQNTKVLPPAEQMKGFLQTLKAPGAIDQALRNLKV